jgi:prepilin-type processing-associated H-X9-DG protein
MRKTLSDKGVAALKPRAARYALPDPELRGHYVRIQPSGAKSFVSVASSPAGKQIWTTIGAADVMSIDEARIQARDAIGRVRAGLPAVEAKADTFGAVTANWLRRHVEPKGLRSSKEIVRLLDRHILPAWRDREFVSIRRSDVTALLDHVACALYNKGTALRDAGRRSEAIGVFSEAVERFGESSAAGSRRFAAMALYNRAISQAALRDPNRSKLAWVLREVGVYKCPADRSTVRDQGKLPRGRSFSMNAYLNDIPNPADRSCWHFLSQIKDPPPVKALVFVDEHEGSIENARFVITQPGDWIWIDFPATRHNHGCNFTFADGHAEFWKWLEPNTMAISRLKGWIQSQPAIPRTDRDLRRVHQAVPRIPIH